ncbi:2-hydroxy-6-oxo-2,4-heptadienoate hydrolase [Pigmentiphaga sp. NML080357]|uniref:alpha/beta fold hydrolase n=1 Tax=Pigmentiphaga sp. NML080357 TaxID=2008675 RepID=UPI000B41AB92|nr:alpha/beta fold hydrolase [Pigmentiphaga sp. NML080357]OVZ55281.1 2-hydroxy-6-oxo-2,4-heptadienoate hydrolase [Pigmentiphaga sp. NML080357]
MTTNPELGKRVRLAHSDTNYHDQGQGRPVVLIHGSGPGVTAWANWRLNIGPLSQRARVLAPDMVGFGYTDAIDAVSYDLNTWVSQVVEFIDALSLGPVDLIGNSFGGAVSLAVAARHPELVRRLVLMGSVGTSFPLTPGLDAVWGYTPSIENMKKLLDIFAYDRSLVSDELAELRYRASMREGVQERFAQMFSPGPRQRYIEALTTPEAELRELSHETLVVHGREDQVIPLQNSIRLASILPRAQLHVFPHCGHWTQIEWTATFNALVGDFLADS